MKFLNAFMRPVTASIAYPIFGLFALECFASAVPELSSNTQRLYSTWPDRLKRSLFRQYDKFARPTQHYNTTIVDFSLWINEITIDEFKSAVVVQAWVHMRWKDDKLIWNTTNYGGLDQLHVANHEVWQPDILLYNSVAGASIEHYGDTHCIIYSDGTVFWAPPTQFYALCDLDLRLWPFDTQNCFLQLGSWMYRGDEIDLRFKDPTYSNDTEVKRFSHWDLLSVIQNRSLMTYDSHEYISLFYKFAISRHSPMYYATVLTPAATVVFMILVIFWLPPQCKEKITLCGGTALIITILLLYFAQKVPSFSGSPPLLICFYSGCLHLVTVSLIISAFVINLSRHPHCRPLPRGIKKLLFGRLGQYLFLFDHVQLIHSQRPMGGQELRENENSDGNGYRQSNTLSSNYSEDGDRENIIAPRMSTSQLEWVLAATAVDRLVFVIFSIILAIMAMVCLT